MNKDLEREITKIEHYGLKVDRLAAWVLLFVVIGYLISGYGMSKGIIDRGVARSLHVKYFPLILSVALVYHGAFASHLALKRWHFWNKFSILVWFVFFVSILSVFLYLELS